MLAVHLRREVDEERLLRFVKRLVVVSDEDMDCRRDDVSFHHIGMQEAFVLFRAFGGDVRRERLNEFRGIA